MQQWAPNPTVPTHQTSNTANTRSHRMVQWKRHPQIHHWQAPPHFASPFLHYHLMDWSTNEARAILKQSVVLTRIGASLYLASMDSCSLLTVHWVFQYEPVTSAHHGPPLQRQDLPRPVACRMSHVSVLRMTALCSSAARTGRSLPLIRSDDPPSRICRPESALGFP